MNNNVEMSDEPSIKPITARMLHENYHDLLKSRGLDKLPLTTNKSLKKYMACLSIVTNEAFLHNFKHGFESEASEIFNKNPKAISHNTMGKALEIALSSSDPKFVILFSKLLVRLGESKSDDSNNRPVVCFDFASVYQ